MIHDYQEASFARLFDLCPHLESLTVRILDSDPRAVFPPGPPPKSLRRLSLKSTDPACDLLPLFVAWDSANLLSVSLDMTSSQRTQNESLPRGLFRGAGSLAVREPAMSSDTWLIAVRDDGGEHAVGLAELPPARVADLVLGALANLQRVRTLEITLAVLEHFTGVVAALPALTDVTVHVESLAHAQQPPPRVTWYALERLGALLDAAPQLETVDIVVWCSWTAAGRLANAEDAQFIVARLAFLETRTRPLPDIRIIGFDEADVPDLGSLEHAIWFDPIEQPKYWPFEAQISNRYSP